MEEAAIFMGKRTWFSVTGGAVESGVSDKWPPSVLIW